MKKILIILCLLTCIPSFGNTYYVATTGNNGNAGTISQPWLTWNYGILQLTAGDTLFIRSGVYMATEAVSISANPNEGTITNPIVVMGYPGDNTRPILDGSNLNQTSMLRIENKYYWTVKNIEIRESHDTDGVYTNFCGINLYASNQIRIENVIVHDIDGQGFRIQDCDTIYIRDCDSYNNYDPYNYGGKADGFQINSTPPVVSMVYFDKCRAWNNSDDGWDFLDNTRGVVDSCWAWANGYDIDGSGQGFKAGLQTNPPPSSAYIFTNNIAVFNSHGGMRANCNGQIDFIDSRWYNNICAFNLGYGFNTSNAIGANMYTNIWRNNISYDNVLGDYWEDASTFIRDHNSWDIVGLTLSDEDFVSLDTAGITAARQMDGDLPYNNFYNFFLQLNSTSNTINAGIDVGIKYLGTAPDLGPFEYGPSLQIIADHNVVDKYDDIPQQWIDSVKKMWVSYAGESHAAGVRVGMNLLETLDPTYAVYTQESGTPAGYTTTNLRFNTATWGDFSNNTGWIHSYGEEDWWTNTTALSRTKAGIDYCNTNGPELTAIGFGWCYDDSHTGSVSATADPVYGTRWYGRSLESPTGSGNWGLDADDYSITGNAVSLDTYLAATQEYVDYCLEQGYDTKVFFSTGSVEPTYYEGEAGYQASLKHQRIRDYVNEDPTRILFDYADILCYDDGSDVLNTSSWNGHTFPFITTTNYGDASIGHIGEEGVVRIAKAMWWMLARIAGWDGNIESGIDSTATNITSFTMTEETEGAMISSTNHTVSIVVGPTAVRTSLAPYIGVSYGATISPASEVSRNFTTPQTYTVTALDGVTTQNWTVTVIPTQLIQGKDTTVNDRLGYDITRTFTNRLQFRNNKVTSIYPEGPVLGAGDNDYTTGKSTNLNYAEITGNHILWRAASETGSSHAIMAGYNEGYNIGYNLLDSTQYGITHEGGYPDHSSMSDEIGKIHYNVFKNLNFAVINKGYDGTRIVNNTFYTNLNEFSVFIGIKESDTGGITAPYPNSSNVKVFNNIFYNDGTQLFAAISIGESGDDTPEEMDTVGFECDYNIYFYENRYQNEPYFIINGVGKTWTEWRALGYDEHSVILDPEFIDLVDFVPGSKELISIGKNLGPEFSYGLSVDAEWIPGIAPETTLQDTIWQVGAKIYEAQPAATNVTSDGNNVMMHGTRIVVID